MIVVVVVVGKVSSLIDNIMLKSFLHESRNNVTRVDLFKKKRENKFDRNRKRKQYFE